MMQTQLDLAVTFNEDAYAYGNRSDGETHGVVLTKPHIVSLMLDLAGYTTDQDLGAFSLLEPSCGAGAFLLAAAERLVISAKKHRRNVEDLTGALKGIDIEPSHVDQTRQALAQLLKASGLTQGSSEHLAECWVQRADFLLAPIVERFDFVVGNPPYIRIEQLSPALQAEYRRRYETLYDRADLYVAFIERSLKLLSPTGVLSFICADRWTLNRYGAPLRSLVTRDFEVRTYVDLHQASPFESEVVAYPSIFVIGREKKASPVRVATLRRADAVECSAMTSQLSSGAISKTLLPNDVSIVEHAKWFGGSDPWVLGSPEQITVLRDLESRFPLLEASKRTEVRIGVATGSDAVFIVPEHADIEPDRLLPLVMRDDISDGAVSKSGKCVINTYGDDGPIDLTKFPRLSRYFSQHESVIRKRHVAQKNKQGWFRTIDRVYPSMVQKPKLLIPDISGSNEIVFEPGNAYPHHNLYFILSDEWDLEVLGALLSSRIALFFVWSYAVKMRGGYLRFQAQYLRRIRVPSPTSIGERLKQQLKTAFRSRSFASIDELAREAYGLETLPEFDFVDARK